MALTPFHSTQRTLVLCLAVGLAAAAGAALAQPKLLPPEATDPVALGLMQGFPPPPDKRVTLATVLHYPNGRWAYHHLRELGPTAAIARSAGAASPLPQALRALDAVAFTAGQEGGPAPLTMAQWQQRTYTDALLVLHRGSIVYERYYAGMQPQQAHALWSMSKSLTGLLATQMVAQGELDASARISHYVPELKDSAWGDATVQQTLDMTTGVAFSEDFSDRSAGIFRYLAAAGLVPAADAKTDGKAGAGVLGYLPQLAKQGEHGGGFQYKTVDAEVLGWVLQRVSGKSLAALWSERLWQPLGAEGDAYVWVDPAGAQLASVGVAATARDLARLGEMLRLNGRFQGRQILAASAVAEIRKGGDPERFKAAGQAMRSGYSYHNYWWIAHDADGSFEAKGLNGQHLHVNPAAELVVVKLSSHPVPNTAFTHLLDRAAFAAIAQALQ